jgi:hypothetical protein
LQSIAHLFEPFRFKTNEDRTLQDSEIEPLNTNISPLNSTKAFLMQQSEANWPRFVLEYPAASVSRQPGELRVRFSESILVLKLSESPPIPLTEVLEKTEVSHDLGILQQLLENLNSSDFADRVSDLRASGSIRERNRSRRSKKPKALDESVITEALAKFEK